MSEYIRGKRGWEGPEQETEGARTKRPRPQEVRILLPLLCNKKHLIGYSIILNLIDLNTVDLNTVEYS